MAYRELGFTRLATSSKKFSHTQVLYTQGNQFDCISEASGTGWVKKKIVELIKSQNQLMTLVIPTRWNWEDKILDNSSRGKRFTFWFFDSFSLFVPLAAKRIFWRVLKTIFQRALLTVLFRLVKSDIWVFEWLKIIHLKNNTIHYAIGH